MSNDAAEAKEKLVQAVKGIAALIREGKHPEAYVKYKDLFEAPDFMRNRPEDQRQALRLMVHSKTAPPQPNQGVLDAHKCAVVPLTDLVSRYEEPGDYEMLGMCHLLLGNEESASRMYRAGLAIERAKTPGSDLCGALMRRISEI